MRALKAVKRERDLVELEPVMLAVSKARALTSVLTQLGETTTPISNNLVNALRDGSHPEETLEWLHSTVGDALREALDDIEREYREVGTNGRMAFPGGVMSATEGGA